MRKPLLLAFSAIFTITLSAYGVGIVDMVDGRAINVFVEAKSKSKVEGVLQFSHNKKGALHIKGTLKGFKPRSTHGVHIHEMGNCKGEGAKAAGGHFTGGTSHHGAPSDHKHHAGDLGNFTANNDGELTIDKELKGLRLYPQKHKKSVWGRSIVVHSGADDFKSQPSGDSGKRIGCGVIGSDK